MTQQAVDNRAKLADIKQRMLNGTLSYEDAKTEAAPVIAAINAKAAELAKKYGKKPSKVTFAGVIR